MPDQDFIDVIERDPAIPGLRALFDSEMLCDAMRRESRSFCPQSASLVYLRYKPGQNCIALYEFCLEGETVRAYVKAYGADAAVKLRKAMRRREANAPRRLQRSMLPALSLEIAPFPNDSKLPTLCQLGNAEDSERLLRRTLPEHPELWNASLRFLAYKPERRLVALASNGDSQAVLKFYSKRAFERALPGARLSAQGSDWRIAKLIGQSKRKSVLAFEFYPGVCLREMTTDGAIGERLAELGPAVASLHASTATTQLPPISRAAERARLRTSVDTLASILPNERDQLNRIASRLDGWIQHELKFDSLIHGDFYDKQILFDGSGFVFLDFDAAAVGDPRTDIANFIAHLYAFSDLQAPKLAQTLLCSYRDRALELNRAHPAGLSAAVSLAVLHIAMHPFRRAQAHWKSRVRALLRFADEASQRNCDWLEV